MKISLIPYAENELQNRAFENQYTLYYFIKQKLEKAGHCVATVDIISIKDADFIIFFALPEKCLLEVFLQGKCKKSIYIPLEPPAIYHWHEPLVLKWASYYFAFILTWQDDLVDNKHFFKILFPYYYVKEPILLVPFNQKKFITMVVGNKQSTHPEELYSKRIEMIRFFERVIPNDFDLYGIYWSKAEYPSYQGAITDKLAVTREYKFAICFENQKRIRGYITEKILDCFRAKIVPIYWGTDNIEDYIPKEAYIDYRLFSSNEALLAYLQSVTEEDYNRYLLAAENFLASDTFEAFLPVYIADQILELIEKKPRTNLGRLGGFIFLCALYFKKAVYNLKVIVKKLI